MSREWKAGDVAMVDGIVCINTDGGWEHGDPRAFRFAHSDRLDIRPLVVLDLNEQSVRRVVEVLREKGLDLIAQQIEAQTTPPKPPEPLGLGAVVEDAEGNRWVRTRRTGVGSEAAWEREEHQPIAPLVCHWVDVEAVKVLRPGWLA